MINQQQNSLQSQQHQQYPQLKIKLMQWKDNIMSIFVAGNATNNKIKRV